MKIQHTLMFSFLLSSCSYLATTPPSEVERNIASESSCPQLVKSFLEADSSVIPGKLAAKGKNNFVMENGYLYKKLKGGERQLIGMPKKVSPEYLYGWYDEAIYERFVGRSVSKKEMEETLTRVTSGNFPIYVSQNPVINTNQGMNHLLVFKQESPILVLDRFNQAVYYNLDIMRELKEAGYAGFLDRTASLKIFDENFLKDAKGIDKDALMSIVKEGSGVSAYEVKKLLSVPSVAEALEEVIVERVVSILKKKKVTEMDRAFLQALFLNKNVNRILPKESRSRFLQVLMKDMSYDEWSTLNTDLFFAFYQKQIKETDAHALSLFRDVVTQDPKMHSFFDLHDLVDIAMLKAKNVPEDSARYLPYDKMLKRSETYAQVVTDEAIREVAGYEDFLKLLRKTQLADFKVPILKQS